MSDGPRYRVPFRRRRQGKTDYRIRLRLLRADLPRAVVRVTNHRILVTVTVYDPIGDRVLASAESPELTAVGFPESSLRSTPAAYLTGYLAGVRAKAAGASSAVLDVGLRHPIPGGRLMGALKGLLDAGIEVPHGEKGLPSNDRLNGQHLPTPLPKPVEAYKSDLAQPRDPTKESA
ncbi:MAG TPA: 50S ribosomal protein L18 [Thermoplasmata archaeon]|nr:50S ribosomal protein L18 [Thermoplasmata archaeon]